MRRRDVAGEEPALQIYDLLIIFQAGEERILKKRGDF